MTIVCVFNRCLRHIVEVRPGCSLGSDVTPVSPHVDGDGVDGDDVRHGDLIGHAAYGDLHPLGGGERLMGGDDPLAGFIGRGEQAGVADGHRLHIAGQAEGGEDFGHGNGGITRENVFQHIVGKFHSVEGEALRLHRSGDFILLGHVQLLGRTGIVDVVDAGLQVLVSDLRQGKGHVDGLALGRLELLTGFGVDHLDVEGVGDGHVLVFVAHLLHGGVRLPLFVHRHALHGELSALGEHAGLGPDGDDHAVHGLGLFKGHGLRNRLQRK